MQTAQIEAWVYGMVELIESGQRVEDTRVELKAEWPDPKRAARGIAGHLNAARGETVLWVIGVDEQRGVVDFDPVELADWTAQFRTQFDGPPPAMSDFVVHVSDGIVRALLFEPGYTPYVVSNRHHGKGGCGPVVLEVPWREGTATRTARRSDLLRVLVRQQRLPHIELLDASLIVTERDALSWPGARLERRSPHCDWTGSIEVYVTPREEGLVVLPCHKVTSTFSVGEETTEGSEISFPYPTPGVTSDSPIRSHTIATTHTEALISGPGRLTVSVRTAVPEGSVPTGPTARLIVGLGIAGEDELTLRIEADLYYSGASHEGGSRWSMRQPDES